MLLLLFVLSLVFVFVFPLVLPFAFLLTGPRGVPGLGLRPRRTPGRLSFVFPFVFPFVLVFVLLLFWSRADVAAPARSNAPDSASAATNPVTTLVSFTVFPLVDLAEILLKVIKPGLGLSPRPYTSSS